MVEPARASRAGERRRSPIGRPIANTAVPRPRRTLRQPLPVGVPGELYIGGDGVTLGYLDRPELTAERFVPDPFDGDPAHALPHRRPRPLARRRPARVPRPHRLPGQGARLPHRARRDRGRAATRSPAWRAASSSTREDQPGDVRLVAYVVPRRRASPIDAGALARHLRAGCREYMVPQHFVALGGDAAAAQRQDRPQGAAAAAQRSPPRAPRDTRAPRNDRATRRSSRPWSRC